MKLRVVSTALNQRSQEQSTDVGHFIASAENGNDSEVQKGSGTFIAVCMRLEPARWSGTGRGEDSQMVS